MFGDRQTVCWLPLAPSSSIGLPIPHLFHPSLTAKPMIAFLLIHDRFAEARAVA